MEMFELDRLEEAVRLTGSLAEGKYPVTGETPGENPALNDPEMIRMMFFIKEVLQAVYRAGGKTGGRTASSVKKKFPLECLDAFEYTDDKPVTRFLEQLKGLANDPDVKGIAVKPVTDWLRGMGYLEDRDIPSTGKKETLVTPAGMEFGLYMQPRVSLYGREYNLVLYSRPAQEYIAAHMEAILNA